MIRLIGESPTPTAVITNAMSLLEADVPIRDVITTDPTKTKAFENDRRAKIRDLFADAELTIEESQTEPGCRDEEIAETTARHHVNVLMGSGMVEPSCLLV